MRFNLISLLSSVRTDRNIAFGKPAYQISTYKDQLERKEYIWSASRAVDGFLYDKADRGYSHTNGTASTKDWWMVDLGEVYPITDIHLHGRLSECMYHESIKPNIYHHSFNLEEIPACNNQLHAEVRITIIHFSVTKSARQE